MVKRYFRKIGVVALLSSTLVFTGCNYHYVAPVSTSFYVGAMQSYNRPYYFNIPYFYDGKRYYYGGRYSNGNYYWAGRTLNRGLYYNKGRRYTSGLTSAAIISAGGSGRGRPAEIGRYGYYPTRSSWENSRGYRNYSRNNRVRNRGSSHSRSSGY